MLSGFSTRVTNTSSLSLQRQLTGKTSFNASGSYVLIRFLNNSGSTTVPSSAGLDSDGDSAGAGLSHRIDARNSLAGNFAYARNTYSGTSSGIRQPGFSSQTASLQFTHQFTRKLSTSLAAGPQWTSIDSPGLTPALSLFANLSANYTGEFSHASLAYSRSTNSGFGVVGGAISNSVTFSAGRVVRPRLAGRAHRGLHPDIGPALGRHSSLHIPHHRGRSAGLARPGPNTLRLRQLHFAKAVHQGTAAAVDLFSGLSNVAGFGLTFSPSAVRLGGHS